MKPKPILLFALGALLAIAFGVTAILPFAFQREDSSSSTETDAADVSEEVAVQRYTPEEVFRRAFWRHPAPEDRILHAERREITGPNATVESWQWFLQIQPGSELLAALRDPATFGLTSTSIPRFPGDRASAPDWFDPSGADEMLQNPSGGLLVFYNPKQNMLFATDAGGGFAPPVTSSQTRF